MMNNGSKFFLGALALIALLLIVGMITSACGGPTESMESDEPVAVKGGALRRYVDEEAGVVCYRIGWYEGIDCLPISQTNLRVGE